MNGIVPSNSKKKGAGYPQKSLRFEKKVEKKLFFFLKHHMPNITNHVGAVIL